MTRALEKTASRAAPANTQQRSSSAGRSMKTQSKAGLSFERAALSPSSKQLFQAISRQATWGALRVSISALSASGLSAFFAGREETGGAPTSPGPGPSPTFGGYPAPSAPPAPTGFSESLFLESPRRLRPRSSTASASLNLR